MINFARLNQRLRELRETPPLSALAVVVGAAAGLAAFLFIKLITVVGAARAAIAHGPSDSWHRFGLLIAPAVGGWISASIIQRFAKSQRGTSTAHVIYALRRRGASLSTSVTVAKTMASALTIGSGGSAGPEGPAVSIGAGLGSVIGRLSRLPPDYLKTLVAAGAAAGIAAVFNAPIAGVMYALEVLLRQTASQAFAVVVLSTVTASVVSYVLVGHRIFFDAPTFVTLHPAEWAAYVFLGAAAAVTARLFTKMFIATERLFRRWPVNNLPLSAMMGGLAVGAIGFFDPRVIGAGHEIVIRVLENSDPRPLAGLILCSLILEKMFATSLTLGSGGSGGLFVPTLSIGAMLGAVIGKLVHWVLPQAAPPWAYALLGMGAVFSGFTLAPFTSIMLLFEMTGDYPIVVPAMLVVGVTTVVSRAIRAETLDSTELREKGLRLHDDAMLSALENLSVDQVMTFPVTTIPESATLLEVSRWFGQHGHTGAPVMGTQGHVTGIITSSELHQALESSRQAPSSLTARDIMRPHVATLPPHASVREAVGLMQRDQVDRVLIVSPDDRQAVVGIITKSDIFKPYESALNHLAVPGH